MEGAKRSVDQGVTVTSHPLPINSASTSSHIKSFHCLRHLGVAILVVITPVYCALHVLHHGCGMRVFPMPRHAFEPCF
jgi:hypothetical protein